MVVYNMPTRLAGCGLCGADAGTTEIEVAPVLPPDENEYAIAPDPSKVQPTVQTSFDTAVKAALKPVPSWAIGVGIGVVALGVVGAVYTISRRV